MTVVNADRTNWARKQAERDLSKKGAGRPFKTPPVDKSCANCGTEIRVYANQLREFNYCGRACFFEHKRNSYGAVQCAAASCENPIKPGRRYCSKECNFASRQVSETIIVLTCQECGDEFPRILRETRAKHRESGLAYCSQTCARQGAVKASIDARTLPLGARNVTSTGYAWTKTGKTATGWEPEHRVVMERIIGRPIRSDEDVHHRNGDKSDNRPENLELWSTSQPKGQRVEDKVAYAIELLRTYDPKSLHESLREELDQAV